MCQNESGKRREARATGWQRREARATGWQRQGQRQRQRQMPTHMVEREGGEAGEVEVGSEVAD